MKYRNYNAKRALPLMAFAVMAFATSCSNDNLADGSSQSSANGKAQSVELTASLNDDNSTDTRVGMTKEDGNKASFYWHKDEAILVQTVSGGSYSGVKFTTSAETGAATATFTGTISDGSLGAYAVYPYSTSHTFTSATALTYNLPAEYTYNKVESNVFSKTEDGNSTYPVNSTNIPLVGKIDNGNIAFKHIGGLVVIRIDAMPYEAGTLTVSADQQLSGNFTIGDLSANEPKIETTTASDDNGKVTFTFSGASTESAGVFYLPLATGSYSGVKIEMTNGDNSSTTQTVNYGHLYVARASVTAIPLYTHDSKLSKFSAIDGNVYTLNGHKFIDLGLSVLWAAMNVGAESETGYGDYFAWGEIESQNPKTYSWDAYKYGTNSNLTKYNGTDQLTTLEAADDAATANWGAGVRMPTYGEFVALLNGCTLTTESGCARRFTGKDGYTGSSIFLPAGNGYVNSQAYSGSGGNYWSSTLNSDKSKAHCLTFTDSSIWHDADYRSEAHTVRAVTEK